MKKWGFLVVLFSVLVLLFATPLIVSADDFDLPPPPMDDFGGGDDMPPPPGDDFGMSDEMPPPPGDDFGMSDDMPPPPGDDFGGGDDMPPPPMDDFGGGDDMPPPPMDDFGGGDDMPPPPMEDEFAGGDVPPPPMEDEGDFAAPPMEEEAAPPMEEPEEEAPVARIPAGKVGNYKVNSGDSLWKISGKSKVYGDAFQWPLLYKANKSVIEDPDLIYPRQNLEVKHSFSNSQIDDAMDKAKETPPYEPHSMPRKKLPIKY